MEQLRGVQNYIESVYAELNRIGVLGPSPESGFLRAGYSVEERQAIDLISRFAVDMGLVCSFDALGNFSAATPSQSGRYVEFASHLDTVPHGGNYDGAAGVVAGLAAIASLHKKLPSFTHGLRLRIWRLEESSTFNVVCFGSRAAFGRCAPGVLDHTFNGTSLRAAMLSQGVDPSTVEKGIAVVPQAEIDSILAHLELHIEQANLLEVERLDIGVISSIRGPRRTQISVSGRFDHSGGTPIGPTFRRDVNLAIAYMQVRLHEMYLSEHAESKDLIQTVGVVNSSRSFNEQDSRVYQNAPAKISGFGYFVFESRGPNSKVRDEYHERALNLIKDTADEFGVSVTYTELGASDGVEQLHLGLQERLVNSCRSLEISCRRMSSGAMHDAAVVAHARHSDGSPVPVGMVFIPCREGISHNPAEFTSYEAIAKGALILAECAEAMCC